MKAGHISRVDMSLTLVSVCSNLAIALDSLSDELRLPPHCGRRARN